MSFSLKDLVSPVTLDQIVSSVKNVASTLGLLPSDWKSGDPEETLVQAIGQTIVLWWNTYALMAIMSGFLDYATAAWLTLLAKNVFNVDRILATFATGTWTASNSSGSPLGPFNPGDLVFVCEDTAKTQTNQATVTVATSGTTPIVIVADELGTGSNAAPSRIVLQTTVLGLSGSNAAAVTAIDDELDTALVVRCRLKFASLSPNGPSQAYQQIALTPSLNGGIPVTRVKVSPWSDTGTVTVTIAGAGGALDSPSVAAVDAAIHQLVTPETVTSSTISATPHSIDVIWQAYARSSAGIDPTAALAAVNASLVAYFAALPIEGDAIPPATIGSVYKDAIIAAVKDAIPGSFQVVISSPAADVALSAGEVPTLGSGTTGALTNV